MLKTKYYSFVFKENMSYRANVQKSEKILPKPHLQKRLNSSFLNVLLMDFSNPTTNFTMPLSDNLSWENMIIILIDPTRKRLRGLAGHIL